MKLMLVPLRSKFDVGGTTEDWLLLFKKQKPIIILRRLNLSAVRPTCLGGAIRDPLCPAAPTSSHAWRLGQGSPSTPVSQTIEGKASSTENL